MDDLLLEEFPSSASVVLVVMNPLLLCSDPLHCNRAGNSQRPKCTGNTQQMLGKTSLRTGRKQCATYFFLTSYRCDNTGASAHECSPFMPFFPFLKKTTVKDLSNHLHNNQHNYLRLKGKLEHFSIIKNICSTY